MALTSDKSRVKSVIRCVRVRCYDTARSGRTSKRVSLRQARWLSQGSGLEDIKNFGQMMYFRKFAAAYSQEMNRSVRVMLQTWTESGSVAAG